MPYRSGSRSFAHPSRRSRRLSRTEAVSIGTVAFLLVAGFVAGLCFLYLWQTTRINELTASEQSAASLLDDIEGVNRVLEFQIEQAFSLERIARIAREQLGMMEPSVIHYVPVTANESS
jgi:cell division protein FtsL